MDVVAILVLVAVAIWVAFWRQRQIMQSYTKVQREVLDRQQEHLALQKESVQLQRESARLLEVIAKAIQHRSS